MKAWITRDDDGKPSLFLSAPEWVVNTSAGSYWAGDAIGSLHNDVDGRMLRQELAVMFGVQPGYCQPITLTATPAGEPTKGTP